jgi:hypothetical protein
MGLKSLESSLVLLLIVLALSFPVANAWSFYEIGIGEKDSSGRYKVNMLKFMDTSNQTIASDLQKLVEEKCDLDKAIAFKTTKHKYYNYGDTGEYWMKPKTVGIYDPNGVLYGKGFYAEGKLKSSGREYYYHLPAVPCPDRSRPGYWKIVFEDGSEITFYVPPKENKGLSVQAICGPASLIALALLPLGVLRRKKR